MLLGPQLGNFLGVGLRLKTILGSTYVGKPGVLITLNPNVDINRFLWRNESYIVKEGIRTTSIRPAGRKDVSVTVLGLHPNTTDQAVIRYLEAHGKVNRSDKIIMYFLGLRGQLSVLES